jgi:hypothetical protein
MKFLEFAAGLLTSFIIVGGKISNIDPFGTLLARFHLNQRWLDITIRDLPEENPVGQVGEKSSRTVSAGIIAAP